MGSGSGREPWHLQRVPLRERIEGVQALIDGKRVKYSARGRDGLAWDGNRFWRAYRPSPDEILHQSRLAVLAAEAEDLRQHFEHWPDPGLQAQVDQLLAAAESFPAKFAADLEMQKTRYQELRVWHEAVGAIKDPSPDLWAYHREGDPFSMVETYLGENRSFRAIELLPRPEKAKAILDRAEARLQEVTGAASLKNWVLPAGKTLEEKIGELEQELAYLIEKSYQGRRVGDRIEEVETQIRQLKEQLA